MSYRVRRRTVNVFVIQVRGSRRVLSGVRAFPTTWSRYSICCRFGKVSVRTYPIVVTCASRNLPFAHLLKFMSKASDLASIQAVRARRVYCLELNRPCQCNKRRGYSHVAGNCCSSIRGLLCLSLEGVSFRVSRVARSKNVRCFNVILNRASVKIPRGFYRVLRTRLVHRGCRNDHDVTNSINHRPFLCSTGVNCFLRMDVRLLITRRERRCVFYCTVQLTKVLICRFTNEKCSKSIARLFYLLTNFPGPRVTLVVPCGVLLTGLLSVHGDRTNRTTRDGSVPCLLRPFSIRVLVRRPIRLFFKGGFRVGLVGPRVSTVRQILLCPFIDRYSACRFFRILRILRHKVILAPCKDLRPVLRVASRLPIRFVRRRIVLVVTRASGLSRPISENFGFCCN